jgi:hypothetical protein
MEHATKNCIFPESLITAEPIKIFFTFPNISFSILKKNKIVHYWSSKCSPCTHFISSIDTTQTAKEPQGGTNKN